MDLYLYSPTEICRKAGHQARELRLARGQSQADLAAAAGVTVSTLKRFEHDGEVGFETIVRIAIALGVERRFVDLFPPHEARSLDEILGAGRKRVRARKKR